MNLDAIVSELFLDFLFFFLITGRFQFYLKYEICVTVQLLLINIKNVLEMVYKSFLQLIQVRF